MDYYLSIKEVATLLGLSLRSVQRQISDEKYITRQVKAKGGKEGLRYEIALNSLPEHVIVVFEQQRKAKLEEMLPILKPAPKPPEKTDDLSAYTYKQREIHGAICNIMRWIKNYDGPVQQAVNAINTGVENQTIEQWMVYALGHCHAKINKKTKNGEVLTISTVEQWQMRFKRQGNYVPQQRLKDLAMKPWYEAAIELYARPQKPTMQWVHEQLCCTFLPPPNYFEVRRFFREKYSQMELKKGRNTGMKLRSMQTHKTRTSEGLMPWDIIHADGWATHFTAPHPITGDYVTYEIWDFHDVATRYVPPFAVGLTENYDVIAKGIENAIRDYGVMASLQTDSSKIIKGNIKFIGSDQLSILQRLGIDLYHPKTVGNAQANGIAENFHAWLDKQSREIGTYQAKNMDSLTLRNTQKLTKKLVKAKANGDMVAVDEVRKQLAKVGKGIIFETCDDVYAWLESKRRKWNDHPHSALKKIVDPKTGALRHQSPQEAMDAFLADGWEPDRLTENELLDAFRPRIALTVRRGVVQPYGKMRFIHPELDHWEGLKVIVSYDIMDYKNVRVLDQNGELICVATYQESVGYRAQTAQDNAIARRAEARIRRKEKNIETIIEQTGLAEKTIVPIQKASVFDLPLLNQEETIEAEKTNVFDFTSNDSDGDDDIKLSAEASIRLIWGVVDDDYDDEQQVKTN